MHRDHDEGEGEGKMKGFVLLVPEKRACTGFATAPSSTARAVARSK